jgi:hypothetical protein
MRTNRLSHLLGWVYIGKWISFPIASEVFHAAWRHCSRRFRFACALGAFVAACVTLVATGLAIDAAGPGRELVVLALGVGAIVTIGVLYQLAARLLLGRQINRIWRWRCDRVCIGCGYDIRGLASASEVCPECGRPLLSQAGVPDR